MVLVECSDSYLRFLLLLEAAYQTPVHDMPSSFKYLSVIFVFFVTVEGTGAGLDLFDG